MAKSQRTKKKIPSDYPQFTFRISQEDKERLSKLVEEVKTIVNSRLEEDEVKVKKNELLVEALLLGLKTLQKKYK